MANDHREQAARDAANGRKAALELVFLAVVGLFVVGGLVAALNYDFVSARAPIVIMVPLILLMAVQVNRNRRAAGQRVVLRQLADAVKGRNPEFNSIMRFVAFMVMLLLLIWFAGHYVGISLFMFTLMYWISREHPVLALLVSVGITVLVYLLFEHGFSIELYRGYLPRLLGD